MARRVLFDSSAREKGTETAIEVVEGEALATLVVNRLRGTLVTAAVKSRRRGGGARSEPREAGLE